jgi:hypothetical protein
MDGLVSDYPYIRLPLLRRRASLVSRKRSRARSGTKRQCGCKKVNKHLFPVWLPAQPAVAVSGVVLLISCRLGGFGHDLCACTGLVCCILSAAGTAVTGTLG